MQEEILLQHTYNKQVFNLGISGDTSSDVLKRVSGEVAARCADTSSDNVLIIAVGVNDSQYDSISGLCRVPVEQTITNFTDILRLTKKNIGKVVFVGLADVVDSRLDPIPWAPTHTYSNRMIKTYNNAIASFAQDNNAAFISLEDVFGDATETCLPDGIHPNEEGHERIYNRIQTELLKVGIL
jgi:lysophospholipase L1-like esterase